MPFFVFANCSCACCIQSHVKNFAQLNICIYIYICMYIPYIYLYYIICFLIQFNSFVSRAFSADYALILGCKC